MKTIYHFRKTHVRFCPYLAVKCPVSFIIKHCLSGHYTKSGHLGHLLAGSGLKPIYQQFFKMSGSFLSMYLYINILYNIIIEHLADIYRTKADKSGQSEIINMNHLIRTILDFMEIGNSTPS